MPTSDTSTIQITIDSVQAKIDIAQSTLSNSAQIESSAIIQTIQSNVPNADSQTAISIATTQEPIATAVADASVKVQAANQAIQSAQTAIETATTSFNNANQQIIVVAQAQTEVDNATATVQANITIVEAANNNLLNSQSSLSTANQNVLDQQVVVDSATSVVESNQISLNTATSAVNAQQAVVDIDQTNVNAAQAVVNANSSPGLAVTIYSNPGTNGSPTMGGTVVYTGTDTNGINEQWGSGGPTVNGATTTTTITETFAGNHLNTTIGITVDGVTVNTTSNGGTYIGAIGFPAPGQDPVLVEQGASKNTLITMPANTTSASFDVFAKNGNSTGTVTYTDGTTETFVIQDDVNPNYPGYVHKETFTAPTGKKIATILVPADWDYYGIDNVSATTQTTSTTTVTDDFQVKWQGIWTPQYTGTQWLTAPADDGVKLYLDGQLVINDWYDKGGGGSTATVSTTSGVGKTFEMWYYENGGGANVALKRYTGNGWEVIPASEFSTSTATSAQLTILSNAQAVLASSTNTLNQLIVVQDNAQTALTNAQTDLQSAQDTLVLLVTVQGTAQSAVDSNIDSLVQAQENLTVANQNLTVANQNLTTEQQNLTNMQIAANINLQSANTLADNANTLVQEATAAMHNASLVTTNYYIEQARLAAEAEAARQAALAAERARQIAQAQALAAAQAAAQAAADAAAQAATDSSQSNTDSQNQQDASNQDTSSQTNDGQTDSSSNDSSTDTQQGDTQQSATDQSTQTQPSSDQNQNQNTQPTPTPKPIVSNDPSQLPTDKPLLPPSEALVQHVQVDKAGVENGGIEFFGTQSQPQVVGEDGKLTPPPPPPGSGLPIPPDAITTTATFIGQPGGTTFNAPDIAVPVEMTYVCKTIQKDGKDVHIDVDGNEHPIEKCTFLPAALDAIPGAGQAVQAMGAAYTALANIGNDMSPITRKKAKKILVITVAVAAIRRRFG